MFFYYCPSQSEYYFIDRDFMYGTLIQRSSGNLVPRFSLLPVERRERTLGTRLGRDGHNFSDLVWLIDEQRWNFINKGKIDFLVHDIYNLDWLLSHDRKR